MVPLPPPPPPLSGSAPAAAGARPRCLWGECGGAPWAGWGEEAGAGVAPPLRDPAGTNRRRGGSWARVAGGGPLSSPPLLHRVLPEAAAFRTLSPWMLRLTRAPAAAREVAAVPTRPLPKAAPGPPGPKRSGSASLRRRDPRRPAGTHAAPARPAGAHPSPHGFQPEGRRIRVITRSELGARSLGPGRACLASCSSACDPA
ncbi:actin nucleation-promoting factor WAS-like [Pongo abelii]|uniref:actin nucleation-promoting factor WAS-like n=1 Tax=Pongo abelii TaxID=9601 RepID=UPI0023E8CB31|nr:actin nucleation-promoting factor WAS-like [Pongo abelii]